MQRQALIIGLGRFGMALARSLHADGYAIIAVDRDDERVQVASEFADRAVRLDATDEQALESLAPESRDLTVCAMGEDSREAAILVTTLLRQLGAKRIVARANNTLVARILRLVGAHEVFDPEVEFAERFARRLTYQGISDEIRLGPNLVISELKVRPAMVGRTLTELKLPEQFGLTVLAVRKSDDATGLSAPDPRAELREGWGLLVVGEEGAAAALHEAW